MAQIIPAAVCLTEKARGLWPRARSYGASLMPSGLAVGGLFVICWWLTLAFSGGGYSGGTASGWFAGGVAWRALWWYIFGAVFFAAVLRGTVRLGSLSAEFGARPAFLLYVGWTLLAVFFSPEPFLSLEQGAAVLIAGLVYFAAQGSFGQREREAFFKTLISAAFLCAALTAGCSWLTGRPFGACGFLFPPGINYTAGLVAAGAAAAFAMLWDPEYRPDRKRIMWGFWLFMAAALVAMRSRGALAGLAAACALVLVMRGRTRLLAWSAAALIAGAVFMPAGWLGYLLKADDAFAFSRLDIWRTALSAVSENPLFGLGPGRFERYFLAHQFPSFDGFVYYGRYTGLAHSQPLAVAVETGVAGCLFYLWFIGGTLAAAKRHSSQDIKAAAAASALFTGSLFSEILLLPVNLALFMLLLGFCARRETAGPQTAEKPGTALVIGLVVWLLAGGFALFRARTDNAPSEKTLIRAAVVYPHDAALWFTRAGNAAAEKPVNLARARAFAARAAELYPTNAVYLCRQAALAAASGDFTAAQTAAERAVALEPNSPAAGFLLAKVYFSQGKLPAALAQYNRAADNAARFSAVSARGGYAETLLKAAADTMPAAR